MESPVPLSSCPDEEKQVFHHFDVCAPECEGLVGVIFFPQIPHTLSATAEMHRM